MLTKVRKSLFSIGAGVFIMAAVPANAGYILDYYDGVGTLVGQQWVCDNGVVVASWGIVTSNIGWGGQFPSC